MLAAGTVWPSRVAVIGGGRWARVLIDVLCGLVPSSVVVSVHSEHNAHGMSDWAAARGLSDRLRVFAEWPSGLAPTGSAIIVANAARDHERAVDCALLMGVPVLVEKPMALTWAAAARLTATARAQRTQLAAGHVFRFARYVDRFAARVAEAGPVRAVRVSWSDPRHEDRYGEAKKYDPSLPILADLLPHVVSLVVSAFAPAGPDRCTRLEVRRGGAHVDVELLFGNLPCRVQLERNGDQRRRLIEAVAGEDIVTLDFSSEPGTITDREGKSVGDPAWSDGPRPVASMLTAFLQGAAGAYQDPRVDPDLGVRACAVIDETLGRYRAAVTAWMAVRLASDDQIDADLLYALNEIPAAGQAGQK